MTKWTFIVASLQQKQECGLYKISYNTENYEIIRLVSNDSTKEVHHDWLINIGSTFLK